MQVGVKCSRGLISWDECHQCVQNPLHPCEYTADVLELMREDYDDPDREPGIESFTPTRLLNCDRQTVLVGQAETYVDIERAWFPVRGNMVHALMEKARFPGALHVIREQRMRTLIETSQGKQLFTAKPDLVVVNSIHADAATDVSQSETVIHIKVVDYKSTNDIKHELVQAKQEHQIQVNLYAWIAMRELPALLGMPYAKVVLDELEIAYADMRKMRRFTSAGWLKTRGKMVQRTPRRYETLDLAPITVYPPEKLERFVVRRIEDKLRAYDELPPILEGERAWLCDWCPVRELCFSLAGRSVS